MSYRKIRKNAVELKTLINAATKLELKEKISRVDDSYDTETKSISRDELLSLVTKGGEWYDELWVMADMDADGNVTSVRISSCCGYHFADSVYLTFEEIETKDVETVKVVESSNAVETKEIKETVNVVESSNVVSFIPKPRTKTTEIYHDNVVHYDFENKSVILQPETNTVLSKPINVNVVSCDSGMLDFTDMPYSKFESTCKEIHKIANKTNTSIMVHANVEFDDGKIFGCEIDLLEISSFEAYIDNAIEYYSDESLIGTDYTLDEYVFFNTFKKIYEIG